MLASNPPLTQNNILSPIPSLSFSESLVFLPAFFRNYLEALEKVREKKGDAFSFRFPKKTTFLLNPHHANEVLVKNSKRFRKSDHYQETFGLLGDSLLTADGESWRAKRKTVAPEFHATELPKFDEIFIKKTDSMIDQWLAEKTVEVFSSMQRFSFEVAGSAFFGMDSGAEAENVIESSHQIQILAMRKLIFPKFPISQAKVDRSLLEIDKAILGIVKKGEEKAASGCPVNLLRRLMDADQGLEPKLRQKNIRDQAVTILLAGHDTTSHALTWLIHLLLWNPAERRKLEQKINFELEGRSPSGAPDKALFIDEVVDETLRLYPPVPVISRISLEDQEVFHTRISKGQLVQLSPWVTHRHPNFWSQPKTFDPSRFSLINQAKMVPGSYFPFGMGPRECIGEKFARRQMKIAIGRILQRCEIRPLNREPNRVRALVLPRPLGPIWMQVEEKKRAIP